MTSTVEEHPPSINWRRGVCGTNIVGITSFEEATTYIVVVAISVLHPTISLDGFTTEAGVKRKYFCELYTQDYFLRLLQSLLSFRNLQLVQLTNPCYIS